MSRSFKKFKPFSLKHKTGCHRNCDYCRRKRLFNSKKRKYFANKELKEYKIISKGGDINEN